MLEFKKGDFEWKDKRKSKVEFVEKDNGRFNIHFWKPNIIQRFLYWIGILKDPRYNGKKLDWTKIDEAGQM
tara:strand:- start:738 stop:950 length:213 start_codon:yes stop_codon:yes gene_type:complete